MGERDSGGVHERGSESECVSPSIRWTTRSRLNGEHFSLSTNSSIISSHITNIQITIFIINQRST